MMAWIFPNQLEGPSKGPKGVCEYPELERQMDQQTQRLADLASKTIRPIMKDRGLLNKPFESSKRLETDDCCQAEGSALWRDKPQQSFLFHHRQNLYTHHTYFISQFSIQ